MTKGMLAKAFANSPRVKPPCKIIYLILELSNYYADPKAREESPKDVVAGFKLWQSHEAGISSYCICAIL